MTITRLILIRHGESQTTVAGIIGGYRSCRGLSPLGRQQAERLRDRWLAHRDFTPDVLLSSQFMRARETAEIIAPALESLPIAEDAGWGEHDPGPECDGLSYDEFVARNGGGWWEGDPFGTSFPGGETIAAFQFRVGQALRRTIDNHPGKTIVVACHGGVVDAVMRFTLKMPPTGSFQIHTLNTSITELELIEPHMWRMSRYNDTAHLAGLPRSTVPVPSS
jgi:2,3-bisphosphoglycerate-dependent phosphoglycerate mutase